MKKKQKIPQSATIERLSHEGRGIALIQHKTTFIQGALPGEEVEFLYTRKKSSFDQGEVHTIKQASPQRREPRCQHYGMCGGCSLQHMAHEMQLEFKQQALAELLTHAGTPPANWLPPITGKQLGYRRKARLSVKFVAKKEKVLVGFRERNGRYVADILHCEVLEPKVGQQLTQLSELIGTLDAKCTIPQIEIAAGDEQIALIFRHLQPLSNHDQEALCHFAQQHQFTIYLQPQGPDSIHLLYPSQAITLHYHLAEFNLKFEFQPQQFIQINADINQQMIRQAINLLDLKQNETVLDLFCGIGNFSLPMAQLCHSVTGVEGENSAVKQAQYNAELNHINNCHFYCADLAVDNPLHNYLQQPFDKILLDPARCGADKILDLIPIWQPQRIVYVSCNPATFARDAAIIHKHGYRLTNAGIMDMFPQTKHVEVISLFEKI